MCTKSIWWTNRNQHFVYQISVPVYHVYEKTDGSHVLSLVAPSEWGGGSGPFAGFIATVKLLADHTWIEC